MKSRSIFAATAVGMIALVAAFPISAYASGTGGTTATITLTAGSLSITMPTGTVALGSGTNTASGTSVAGALGTVTVTDTRGVVSGAWSTSVSSTDFTPSVGSVSLPATGVGYVAGVVTTTGAGIFTPTNLSPTAPGLSAPVAVVIATALAGDSTASWSPTITVTVPANANAGTFTATITHSVA